MGTAGDDTAVMLPDAVVLDCSRCGGPVTIPVVVEGPFTDENGAHCQVYADADQAEHTCQPRKRPPNKSDRSRP